MECEVHPYSDPATDQMQMELEGISEEGFELMKNARKWAYLHPLEWCHFKNTALRLTRRKGYASANYCTENMRNECMCKVPNAYAPAFARIAMEEDSAIKFKCGKSKTDGFTTVLLNK